MLDLVPQLLARVRLRCPASDDPEIQRLLMELERDGVAIMQNSAPSELITAALQDMDRLVERMPQLQGTVHTKRASTGGRIEYPVHEYQRDLNIFRSHDPLVFSSAYAHFLLLPALLEVVEGYLGKNWFYQAMIATRTEPSEPTRKGFAQWHHDARGRKLNIFLLLTDVPADGPATIIVKGSHRLVYARDRQLRNFFDDDEVAVLQRKHKLGSEYVCHGSAGSLVFFDANSLHLGRRTCHRRDAFQVNCMTKRDHLWPHTIPQSLLSSLDPAQRSLLLKRADLRPI